MSVAGTARIGRVGRATWVLPLAIAALAGAAWIGSTAAPAVEEGIASLSWPDTRGLLLHSRLEVELDAATESDPPEDTWVELSYAYSVPDDREGWAFLVGRRFDVSTDPDAPRKHENALASHAVAREIMASAPHVRVRYDPRNPSKAVLHRGIPLRTGLLIVIGVALLGMAVHLIFRTAKPKLVVTRLDEAKAGRAGHPAEYYVVLGTLLYVALGELLPAATAPWMGHWLGRLPPWWMLPLYALFGVVGYLYPRVLRRALGKMVVGGIVLLVLVGGTASIVAAVGGKAERPALEVDDQALMARLVHDHPVVRADAAWRVSAKRVLPGAVNVLPRILADPDPWARRAAIHAAKELGAEAGPLLPELLKAIRDPVPLVRRRAAWAAASIAALSEQTVPEWAGLGLLDLEPDDRIAGLMLLRAVEEPGDDMRQRLLRLFADPDTRVVGGVCALLRAHGIEGHAETRMALGAFARQEAVPRTGALDYLAKHALPRNDLPAGAYEAFKAELAGDEHRQRKAVEALERLGAGAERLLPELIETAATGHQAVTRQRAAGVLATFREPMELHLPALRAAVEAAEDEETKQWLSDALKAVEGE